MKDCKHRGVLPGPVVFAISRSSSLLYQRPHPIATARVITFRQCLPELHQTSLLSTLHTELVSKMTHHCPLPTFQHNVLSFFPMQEILSAYIQALHDYSTNVLLSSSFFCEVRKSPVTELQHYLPTINKSNSSHCSRSPYQSLLLKSLRGLNNPVCSAPTCVT